MKAVLSQTGFCGGAHLHGSKENRLHAELDSKGWPQKRRKKAIKLIKEANAVHIAGDQHLATVIHHGIDKFEDGPWAFVVPAIVNNYYSRWWWPKNEKSGKKYLDFGTGIAVNSLGYSHPYLIQKLEEFLVRISTKNKI
mgnify:CR=1 FL=1